MLDTSSSDEHVPGLTTVIEHSRRARAANPAPTQDYHVDRTIPLILEIIHSRSGDGFDGRPANREYRDIIPGSCKL